MDKRRLVVTTLLVVLLAACGGGSPNGTKYTQTWSKSYATTTCLDWAADMSDHERFVMAGDFVTTYRKDKSGTAAVVPPDADIDRAVNEITRECGPGSAVTMPLVAAAVFAGGDFEP